jgi:hypothetical protein
MVLKLGHSADVATLNGPTADCTYYGVSFGRLHQLERAMSEAAHGANAFLSPH